MKRDIDFIEEKFAQDGLKAPETLSEEAMLAKLMSADSGQSAPQEKVAGTRPRKQGFVHRHRGWIALAACLALALVTTPLWRESTFWNGADVLTEDSSTSLAAFTSYDQVEERLDQIRESVRAEMEASRKGLDFAVEDAEDLTSDMAVAENEMAAGDAPKSAAGADADSTADTANNAAGNASGTAEAGSSHSDTYVQVEGVDEADIIKTDGKYIYHITGNGSIRISEPDGRKAKTLATIEPEEEEAFQDLYLAEGKVIAVGSMRFGSVIAKGDVDIAESEEKSGRKSDHKVNGRYYSQQNVSTVTVFDTEDLEHPKMLQRFEQSGDVVSSRMADGYVYLVTNHYAGGGDDEVPWVTQNAPANAASGKKSAADGEAATDANTAADAAADKKNAAAFRKIKASDISMLPHSKTPAYAVLSAIDIDSGTQVKARSKAILGASETIYCNGEHMYIAAAEGSMQGGFWYLGRRPEYTRILKATLKDGKVKFRNSAKVRGGINDQFSMDEKDGNLRVATTSLQDDKDENNVFVLDKDMRKLGSVTGLARDEHIEAVRFLGERGYVITYKQTDPLFVLDLSDPKNPKVDGSVKISGFSTLLVPVDEKTLLGIGHCTESTEFGEALSGTKLALFDVSDPSKPKVKDSKEFPGMDSPAQYDHKALIVNKDEGWYAIPYDIWNDTGFEEDQPDVITEDAEESDATEDGEISKIVPPEEPDMEGGVLLFSADKAIHDVEKHPLTNDSVQRAIYIGDYIYALDVNDKIIGFRP